ncbi:protein LDOC1-like [Erythrolamprus reginae]|uniref:protein LDOC1-like n=1 Tax=Erythrolamprus reginae TaxID=121349 RepID=UPI00396CBD06
MAASVAEMQAVFEALGLEIQALTQMVLQLQNQVDVLFQQPASPLVQLEAPAPQPPPQRKCFVAMPKRFWGDRRMFSAFLSQVQLFINAQMIHFPMDAEEVVFLCSLLASPAASWVSPLLDQDDPILQDYTTSCTQLRQQFLDPVRVQMAMRTLKQLKQGSCPLAEYMSDFCSLMVQVQ